MSAKITEEQATAFIEHIFEEGRIHDSMAKCDNMKLLWLLLNTPQFQDWPMSGPISAIRDEIENRLYPEYDGDKVQLKDWGWQTPEGNIVYIKP